MAGQYEVNVQIGRQEDGLWRVEVPDLIGCWVDAPTLARALAELQDVIAMTLDHYADEERPFPEGVTLLHNEPTTATIPVVVGEHRIIRYKPRGKRRALDIR